MILMADITQSIRLAWHSLLLNICEPIYKLIAYLYNLFETVGTASLLTSDSINKIYTRVGFLLGLYMLFRLTFSFVQMLINPDIVSDKEKGVGNIIKKSILVVAVLVFMPTIFEKAMDIQNLIVGVNGQNVIAKLILPEMSATNNAHFGSNLSAYTFSTFYTYDEAMKESDRDCPIIESNDSGSTDLIDVISRSNSLAIAYSCISKEYKDDQGDTHYQIDFSANGFLAIIVGGFICWILAMYTISVGVRVIQLAFLRIISPLAIMSYLSPKKDTTFEKWGKMCITTYIDLFIRMAIIYFAVYIIGVLMQEGELILATTTNSERMVKVILIMAILLFAKKAPELLKELFPSSGAASLGFGFGAKDRIPEAFKRAAGVGAGLAVGAAVGFAGGVGRKSVKGAVGGLFGGALRGGAGGLKKGGYKNVLGKQKAVNAAYRDLHADGGSYLQMKKAQLQHALGVQTSAEQDESKIKAYQSIMDDRKFIKERSESEAIKNDSFVAGYSFTNSAGSLIVRNSGDKSLAKLKATADNLRQNGGSAEDIANADLEYAAALKAASGEFQRGKDELIKDKIAHMERVGAEVGISSTNDNLADRVKDLNDSAEKAQSSLQTSAGYTKRKAEDDAATKTGKGS